MGQTKIDSQAIKTLFFSDIGKTTIVRNEISNNNRTKDQGKKMLTVI